MRICMHSCATFSKASSNPSAWTWVRHIRGYGLWLGCSLLKVALKESRTLTITVTTVMVWVRLLMIGLASERLGGSSLNRGLHRPSLPAVRPNIGRLTQTITVVMVMLRVRPS